MIIWMDPTSQGSIHPPFPFCASVDDEDDEDDNGGDDDLFICPLSLYLVYIWCHPYTPTPLTGFAPIAQLG